MGRRRSLVGVLVADTTSLTGTRLVMVALPWLVLVTTDNPALTGLVAAASVGPQVICQALAGPLVDRLGARKIAVRAEAASVATLAVVPLLHAVGLLSLPASASGRPCWSAGPPSSSRRRHRPSAPGSGRWTEHRAGSTGPRS